MDEASCETPGAVSVDRATRSTILLVASLASFLSAFMGSSVNIALPSIAEEFQTGAVEMGWITTAYLLAAAVGLVPFGRLADLHGRRRVFTLGFSVYTLAAVACAFAPTNTLLIVFRVVQGLGAAMVFSTSAALVSSAFPSAERGRALGWNIAAVYTGLSAGPFLGGILTEQLGWRSLFLVNAPLGLLVLALFIRRVRVEWAEFRGARFDLVGSLVYGVGIVALMVGFSVLPDAYGFALLFTGALALIGFGVRQGRVESPLLDVRLFRRNRALLFSNLAALVNYAATAAVGFLLSLYLQVNRGLSPEAAGLVLVAQPVLQAIFSPLAGRLSDRVQPRFIASVGMAMTALGLALLAQLGPGTPLALLVAILAWLGLAFALFSSPNTNAVMSSVDPRFYGAVSGTLSTMRALGQISSMGIAMLLLSLFVGDAAITPETASQFLSAARVGFALFAGLCALGVAASLARGRLERAQAPGAPPDQPSGPTAPGRA
jgi:EmrB/QacA subfamily drug resistance transporter